MARKSRSERGTKPSHAGSTPRPPISPPSGLRAWRLGLGGDSFALMEWPDASRPFGAGLTDAEREVARLVMEGLSNAEIARRRGTSIRTVANQVASVFAKAGAGSRRELAALRA